ncbi:Serine/threonine-protein phosphatase 4 regulatory subunit 2 [Portunus trituberculatus]|uniref:Serine/threonine-protein phosphatase 4 regulatory subunit 2 n=1 Tax=Portunus trituberculatus TaxID=210409 RepID=A0A5B7FA98_PORTR|nr:Serine/threonine-protein phosphatase 4 regulatory subunit 2 [Portunus trituberculatus]
MSKMLDDYIHHIAKTGDTIFPWHRIRHFMQHMLETVMNEFYETCGSAEDVSENSNVPPFSFFNTRDKLLHHFDTFTGAPFTIQRLCEIMVDPTKHYRRTDKFLRGLEKNVLVVSSIEPGSRQRRTEDPQHTLVNGLQEGGLHTSPIPSLPHHPKRLPHTQATNSVLNNTNVWRSNATLAMVPSVQERESSSEAAAADEESRSQSPGAADCSLQAEESSSSSSHEADSTSQSHTGDLVTQPPHTAVPAEAEVDSAVPSPPPTPEVDNSTEATTTPSPPPVESVETPTPSNSSSEYPTSDTTATAAAAHTTSETPTPSTSTTTTTASITTASTTTTTTTTNHSKNCVPTSPDSETPEPAPAPAPSPASSSAQTPAADTDSSSGAATSSTTNLPPSASSRGDEQEGGGAESCHKQTLASISCSSSHQREPAGEGSEWVRRGAVPAAARRGGARRGL